MSEVARPLVRLRCGISGCREVVLELAEVPADWSASVETRPCPRHDGLRRKWWDEVARRKAKGLDPRPEFRTSTVALRDLRQMFYLADTLGKTQEDVIERRLG